MVEIQLKGPGKNALGSAMIASLTAQIADADGQPILFSGAGDAFSAGLNLKEVGSLDVEGMAAFLARLEAFFRTIYLYPGPTVAAVNGHAIAGGCIVAMCCDYSVATTDPSARIGLNEVGIGLRFPPALLRFVQAVIAPQYINQVVLGAGLHSPAAAARLGLVSATDDQPLTAARAYLQRLAKHPADAYRATKMDLRDGVMHASDAERATFNEQVVPFWTSPALKAMITKLLS